MPRLLDPNRQYRAYRGLIGATWRNMNRRDWAHFPGPEAHSFVPWGSLRCLQECSAKGFLHTARGCTRMSVGLEPLLTGRDLCAEDLSQPWLLLPWRRDGLAERHPARVPAQVNFVARFASNQDACSRRPRRRAFESPMALRCGFRFTSAAFKGRAAGNRDGSLPNVPNAGASMFFDRNRNFSLVWESSPKEGSRKTLCV